MRCGRPWMTRREIIITLVLARTLPCTAPVPTLRACQRTWWCSPTLDTQHIPSPLLFFISYLKVGVYQKLAHVASSGSTSINWVWLLPVPLVFHRPHTCGGLTDHRFSAYTAAVKAGEPLNKKYADKVAKAVQKWAAERGAVNYTHSTTPHENICTHPHTHTHTLSAPIDGITGTHLSSLQCPQLVYALTCTCATN